MIKVENLKKKFIREDKSRKKTEFYAVDGETFEAKDGEVVGVLGPNGAGKTTTLRMMAGIMEPTEGTVEFDGMDYKNNEIEIKRKLAFLSGNTKLYNRISIHELLQMCGRLYGMSQKEIDEREEIVLNVLNLTNLKFAKIGGLSTGQTQRVGIARCILHDPKYYILDEATTGLDLMSSQIILDFIKQERDKGKTIIYSTHYMEEAENICNKVVMIDKGKVIQQGTPDEIKKITNTTNLRDAFFALVGGVKYE